MCIGCNLKPSEINTFKYEMQGGSAVIAGKSNYSNGSSNVYNSRSSYQSSFNSYTSGGKMY